MITQATTPTRFFSPDESVRLFTSIWHHSSDEAQARETLIQGNLASVRNFILKHPAFFWYDWEDAEQEAYLHLALALDKVPPSPDPGAYLYKAACTNIRRQYQNASFDPPPERLDAILPGTEKATLGEVLAAPAHREPPATRSQLLTALLRLPLGQQQELQEFFQLPDFQPRANSRHALRSANSQKSGTRGSARFAAYQELRHDSDLQQMVEPLRQKWSRAPSKTLKYYRLLHGWSQRTIAEALGVSMSLVGFWEKGIRYPGALHREKLCQLYGVTAEQVGLRDTIKRGHA